MITGAPNCSKCGGTGLLPFFKDGRVIPNVQLFCECHQDEPEHEHLLRPGDFDYPKSDTFRAWSFEHCGLADPGYIPPKLEPEPPPEQVIIHRHSNMSKQEHDMLEQMARQVVYLKEKLTEREKKAQEKERYTTRNEQGYY